MRKLRLYRYGCFEDSKPEIGLTFIDGKCNAEWLYDNKGKEYDMYIAFSRQSRYIIDAEKNELVLKNSWKLGESYGKSDCMFGDNFHINTELTLDSEKLRITTYTYDDFANVVLGVSENCKTIEDAKHYLEEHGLHNSPDSPNLYMSAPVYPDFIHLNVHSHYSIMKSQITIPAAVDKAVADGMKGMALTDVGVMYGIKEFVEYCAKVNNKRSEEGKEPFKPIIGCEMYVAPRTMHDKDKGDEKCGRLIVLAKNLTGYKNLCKLVSNSWTEGLTGEMPRTDHAELEKYKEGLIVIVSGNNSEIASHAIAGDMGKALSVGEWYKNTFGDNFYLGIQRNETLFKSESPSAHNIVEEVRSAYVKIDIEYNIKSVCVNSCNYLNKEDGAVLDHLLAIANNTTLDDSSCPHNVEGEWMKTREELTELYRGRLDVRINSLELFEKVEFYSIESFPLLPCFSIPESFGTEEEWRHRYSDEQIRKEFMCDEKGNNPLDEYDASKKINQLGGVDELYRIKFQSDYLAKLAYDGAKRIYGTLTPEIEERLRFELHIIKIIGFPSYFLFVQDYVNAAQKELNVWVGPGRGSAVGSLVNYCLGITKIDPLKHGLLFERFLNPDRFSLPDIDLDFDVDGRGKVIQWIKDKYGEENCANIVTFSSMSARNAIKDVGRIEKLSLEKANALCRAIPDRYYGKNVLKHAITSKDYEGKPENPMLVAALNSNDQKEANTVKYASELEGIVRGTGIHACGLIICPDAIANHVPVAVDEDPDFPEQKALVTQYDGHFIESTGLVKFDFLGLWTLSEIKECIRLIKQNRGIDVNIDNIPLDDEKTFKLYQEGRTTGTFQFESPGMQKYLLQLQPTTLDDLVALNALYSPGPMDLIPSFIARKKGKQPITYDLPIMEAYLKDTYGITVYQEQIMHLVMAIAGFTRGESDALRKALGRQYYPIVNVFKEMFITGGEKNGYNPDILEKIWDNWEIYGKYAFNKAHALAYTWLAYQTAYLKAHYPAEYMTAILSSRRQYGERERVKLMDECKAMGIHVLPPSVNNSDIDFSVNTEGDILFGLCTINGIYEDVALEIVDNRNSCGQYKDIYDFAKRVNRSICDKETFELLAKSGAFECFGLPREQYLGKSDKGKSSIDLIFDYALIDPTRELFEVEQPILPAANILPLDKYLMERELLGYNFSPHPIETYREIYAEKCNGKCDTLNHLYDFEEYTYIILAGLVTDIKTYSSRKTTGEGYGVTTIEDESGKAEIILLSNTWNEYRNMISLHHPVVIRGYCKPSSYNCFVVDKVYDLDTQKMELEQTLSASELNKGKLSVKVTCTGCFSGAQKPEIFIEDTMQFQFWLDIYKEGLQKPNTMSYTDVELYRGEELIGSVRGDLNQRQSQRLCKLQRETDDCCGYDSFLHTPEEYEEISRPHANKEALESASLFDVKDFGDSGDFSNDDLPF